MSGKKAAAAPPAKKATKGPKKGSKPKANPLFVSTPKNFRIGGSLRAKVDVSRFVRWPKYIRLQRQKKILFQRLKIPPSINVFRNPLDRAEAVPVFKLLEKYRPEDKAAKKDRLKAAAEAKVAAPAAGDDSKRPKVLKFGLNHITHLVETGKAAYVVIASDVDPIELVVWLPALCRKVGVPYAIVNNKGRLGTLVGKKSAAAVALATKDIKPEDRAAFAKLVDNAKEHNDRDASTRKWGGGVMGLKTQRRLKQRAEDAEEYIRILQVLTRRYKRLHAKRD